MSEPRTLEEATDAALDLAVAHLRHHERLPAIAQAIEDLREENAQLRMALRGLHAVVGRAEAVS